MKKLIYGAVVLMAAFTAWAIDIAIPLSKATRAYHAGKLEEAEKVAEAHLTWESRGVDSRFVAARVKVDLGKFADAVVLLRENIKESPADFRSWSLLGITHVRLADEAEGVKCLKKALELNPYHGQSLLWLAKSTADKKEQTRLLELVLVMEERDSATAKEALKMLEDKKDK